MTLQNPSYDSKDLAALFTRDDGSFLCARWGRPIAPVIFGLADESLGIFRAAIRAVARAAGAHLTETDPEMGSNLMLFFLRDWAELGEIPGIDQLTGQADLSARLPKTDAEHYRLFRFDADGAIRACLIFVRMSGPLGDAHPGQLAEALAVRSMLTFSQEVVPSKELAQVIRAAYDPLLPAFADDPSHALRLTARILRGSDAER